MKKYPKGTHSDVLSAMIFAGFATFAVYAVLGLLFELIKPDFYFTHIDPPYYSYYGMYGTPRLTFYKGLADLAATCVATLLFIGFFHVFYTKKQNKTYYHTIDPDKPFSRKAEFARFGKENILPLLHVYGILAVINWIAVALYVRPVAAVLFFVFPFNPQRLSLLSPEMWCVLAPVLSVLLIVPTTWLLAVHGRRKLHEEKIRERELRKTWSSSNNQ